VTTTRPWYEELFESGDYVRFWLGGEDAPRIPAERTAQQVDFVVEKLALPPGAAILDLCCGHGRHAILLARRGYRVTGLDLSRRHLEMAGRAAAAAQAEVEWVEADMRRVPESLSGRFDAVINMFTSFGYFEEQEEDEAVLRGVARSLRPGGRFLMDFMHREWLARNFRPRDWEEIDGALVLRDRYLDLLRGRSGETITIVEQDGSRRTTSLSVRIYTLAELTGMLARTGLRFDEGWGDFDGSPLTLDGRRLILLAEKA
jgi:SAM-dependent methyltransferase